MMISLTWVARSSPRSACGNFGCAGETGCGCSRAAAGRSPQNTYKTIVGTPR